MILLVSLDKVFLITLSLRYFYARGKTFFVIKGVNAWKVRLLKHILPLLSW